MKICDKCGQEIPQAEGRLICSACSLPITRGQRWTHGGDGRPKHKDCTKPAGIVAMVPQQEMNLEA